MVRVWLKLAKSLDLETQLFREPHASWRLVLCAMQRWSDDVDHIRLLNVVYLPGFTFGYGNTPAACRDIVTVFAVLLVR
jgi:hypothetical protein